MSLTKQEKINLCFFFLTVFENINDLFQSFFRVFENFYKGVKYNNSEFTQAIRELLRKDPSENKKLNYKDRNTLFVAMDLVDIESLERFSELKKIRDEIGHNSGRIYSDDSINLDYFKLEKLLNVHTNIFKKMCSEVYEDNKENIDEILQIFLVNVSGIKIMFLEMFSDSKFDKYRELLETQ